MTIEQVSDKLKEIGPFVRHDSFEMDGKRIHVWAIGSAPAGPDAVRASLWASDLDALDDMDWEETMTEGKQRFMERA